MIEIEKEVKDPEQKKALKFAEEIGKKTLVRLYDVQDIQKELEELTENEDQMKQASAQEKAYFEVKKKIKMTFKRNLCAPKTDIDFYMIGRVLGMGGYGKVNLALHKLSQKLCAVKSINKLYTESRSELLRVHNEKFMVQRARLRHPNVV